VATRATRRVHRLDLPRENADLLNEGLDTPVGPGSTLAAVALANAVKVRAAEPLVKRDAMPAVITSSALVGPDRSRELFEAATTSTLAEWAASG
jgi:hypothetical protein